MTEEEQPKLALSGKQRRALRALGHHLKPVVQVGQSGVSPSVVDAVSDALTAHELIKVKIGDALVDRDEVAEALSGKTGSAVAQVLGRTILLYRPREKKSKLPLSSLG